MKSFILNRGQKFYTDLEEFLKAFNGSHEEYNWLITEPEITSDISMLSSIRNKEYSWITGEEFTALTKESHQAIWGIFSGFNKSIKLENILKYKLPSTENELYWGTDIHIQHSLAEVEIYAYDSHCTFFISKNDIIADKFLKHFPMARDLNTHNIRLEEAFAHIDKILKKEKVITNGYYIWQALYLRNDNPIDDYEIIKYIREQVYKIKR